MFLAKKLPQYDPISEEEEDDSDDEVETRMREELNRSDEYSEESEVEEPEESSKKADEPLGIGKKRKKLETMPQLTSVLETPGPPLVSPPKKRREVFEVIKNVTKSL